MVLNEELTVWILLMKIFYINYLYLLRLFVSARKVCEIADEDEKSKLSARWV